MRDTILLIQPPIQDLYLTKKRTVPYGLISIAGSLMKQGFSVRLLDAMATPKSRIIDLPQEMTYLREFYGEADHAPFSLFHQFRHYGYSFQHIAKLVKDLTPFLVGISSLFSPYAEYALMIAEVVKNVVPECVVVLGGHHPTAMPAEVMACRHVDFVLRGDGEASMPLLAEFLLKQRSRPKDEASSKEETHNLGMETIPGIVFRQPQGGLHISPSAVVENLDSLAAPAVSLLNFSFYRRGGAPGYAMTASRGCPFSCSYCSVGKRSHVPFRLRTVASVIREMSSAVNDFQTRFIDFEDENISLDRLWFKELLQSIVDTFGSETLELRAMNGLFPPSLDDEAVSLMKKAGFRILNLSLGTTCRNQLKRFNRSEVTHHFKRALMLAQNHDLEAVGYIIVGAPYQDPIDSVADLLYLASQRVLAGVSVFYPAPGSRDFARCRKMGLLPQNTSLYRSSALPISHVTRRLDSVTLLRLGRVINFMKHLLDHGIDLPNPAAYDETTAKHAMDIRDRMALGAKLLQWFLYDGMIRGITPTGKIYTHSINKDLTRRFVEGLQHIHVQGCR